MVFQRTDYDAVERPTAPPPEGLFSGPSYDRKAPIVFLLPYGKETKRGSSVSPSTPCSQLSALAFPLPTFFLVVGDP